MNNRLLIGASDKTALFLHFLQQDFPAGFTLIDPDGRLAEAAVDMIPHKHTRETFYFNPADAENVASFNVFDNTKDKAKLVQDLCGFIDAMFAGGDGTLTRLHYNLLLPTMLTILLDNTDVSFSRVLNFLSDPHYQQRCLEKCTNFQALDNWKIIENWSPQHRDNAFALIQSMLGKLLLYPVIQRMLEQPLTYYFGKTKILIANLSRAKIGDQASKLLGTLLISRATTPVYINDFGFLASDYLASLFSTGGYTIAAQFLSTLPPNVCQVVQGFEEKYVYRTTPEDAEKLKFSVGIDNIRAIVDQRPGEFLPPIDINPPRVTGRSLAVLNRSIARHTRKRKNG